MAQAFRVKKTGEVVYRAVVHDYGLASDDTRVLGETYISVSDHRDGGYPTHTVRQRDIEPCDVPPLPPLTDDHVKTVCRLGAGAETCRYLTVGSGGFECGKLSGLRFDIDCKKDMIAKGDNCEGRSGKLA